MEEIAATIRQFILSKYLAGESADNLPDDLPLQSSAVLDSLAMLGLITFLEEQFHIELDVYDTSAERFDSIRDIAAAVRRKAASTVR
jgi:acyl carrier protein